MVAVSSGEAVAIAVLGFFQRVTNDESVKRGVAQRVGFVDELTQAVIQQQFRRLQSIFSRFFTQEKEDMENRHLLGGCSNGRLSAAGNEQLDKSGIVQRSLGMANNKYNGSKVAKENIPDEEGNIRRNTGWSLPAVLRPSILRNSKLRARRQYGAADAFVARVANDRPLVE